MTAPTAVYNVPLGIEGLLYVGDAGATPTVALGDDQKMSLNLENTLVEWNTRGKPLFTSGYAGQKITGSFTVTKNNLNVSLTALRVAAQTRIPIAIKSLDKLAGFGIDADWNVKMVKEDQDKDKEDTVDFEISICTLYRDPTWTNPS